MEIFTITGELIALNQLLKATGLASTGGEAKALITGGEVLLNGEIETRIRKKIYAGDLVICKEQELHIEGPKID